MQYDFSVVVTKAPSSHMEYFVSNVLGCALEAENLILPREVVTSSIKNIFSQTKYGYGLSAMQGDKVVGTALVSQSYDYIRNRLFYWVLDAFTLPEYRCKGVYKALHKYLWEQARKEKAYSVKLYVDKGNEVSHKAHSKIGYAEKNEEYWEVDFTFRGKKNIDSSCYLHGENEKILVKRVDTLSAEKIKLLKYSHVNGENGTTINYEGLQKLIDPEAYGDALVIEKNDEILGLVGTYYEYSDWRDAINYYIYDIRIVDTIDDNALEAVTALILEKIAIYLANNKAGTVRLIFDSKYSWMKSMIQKIGFLEPHYDVFEIIL